MKSEFILKNLNFFTSPLIKNIVGKIIFVLALFFNFLAINAFNDTKPVMGIFEGKRGMNLDGYPIFFNGNRTKTDSAGRFQMQTSIDLSKEPLFLLVSSGVEWCKNEKTKTVKYARHDSKLPYKFYSIFLKESEPNKPQQIEIRPDNLESRNYQIPIERCLIVPINAYFVKEIKAPKQFEQAGVFNLPKIILQDEDPLKQSKSNFLHAQGCPQEIHDFKVNHLMERGKAKASIRSMEEMLLHQPVAPQIVKTKNRKGKNVEITISFSN